MVRARALLGLVVAGCPKATPSAEPKPLAVVAPPSPFAIELLPGEREPKVSWDRVRLPEAAPSDDILEPFFWGWHVIRNRCRAAASFVIAPASVRPPPEAPDNTLAPGEAVRVSVRDGDKIYMRTSTGRFAEPVAIELGVEESTTTIVGPGPCVDIGVVTGVWPPPEPRTDPVLAELEAILPHARAASRRRDANAAGALWSRVAAMVFVPGAPDNATVVAWLEAERHFRWAYERGRRPNDLRVAHELLLHLRDHTLDNSGEHALAELHKTRAAELERVGIDPRDPARFALLFFEAHPRGTAVRLDGALLCREPCLVAVPLQRSADELELVDPTGDRIPGPVRPTFTGRPAGP